MHEKIIIYIERGNFFTKSPLSQTLSRKTMLDNSISFSRLKDYIKFDLHTFQWIASNCKAPLQGLKAWNFLKSMQALRNSMH